MIVEPDFLTHHKTLLLQDMLDGDELAPLYILRLWCYCHSRRTTTVPDDPLIVKSICRYRGATEIAQALVEAHWLDRVAACPGQLVVHEWHTYNAQLVSRWSNGRKGGRKPEANRSGTGTEPNRTGAEPEPNRSGTGAEPEPNRTEPERNRSRTDANRKPTREEKRREDLTPSYPPRGTGEGDEAHRILSAVMRITFEADMRARQSWPLPVGTDYAALARECAVAAENEAGGVKNPYTYWRACLERAHGRLTEKKTAPQGGMNVQHAADLQGVVLEAMRGAGV